MLTSLHVDPPFYIVDAVIRVIEGNPVRIDLLLDAKPDPFTFNWQFEGQPLSTPQGGSLGVDFIDFGSSIDRTASGNYFIESTNDAGTGNATFQLIVYCECSHPVFSSTSRHLLMF